MVALGKRFPPPDPAAITADCRWLQERWRTPMLAPYQGTHAAVYNGEVVGHGDNTFQLPRDLAKRLNVHPQRFALEYVPRPGDAF